MAGHEGTSSDGDTPWTEQDRAAVCDRVRSAAQLPGVEIEESHGHLGFAVRAKRFAWLLVDHHGDGRLALTLKAPPGEQTALVGTRRGYFIPSYLGSRGWIGIDLAPQRPTRLGRNSGTHRTGVAHERIEEGHRRVGQNSATR